MNAELSEIVKSKYTENMTIKAQFDPEYLIAPLFASPTERTVPLMSTIGLSTKS